MIGTVMRISWIGLRRDRMALVLTFILPAAFFSIFAAVFGAIEGGTDPVRAAVVQAAPDPVGERLVEILAAETALELVAPHEAARLDREGAVRLIRERRIAAAVVLPDDFARSVARGSAPEVELLTDSSDPLASGVVTVSLQSATLRLVYELLQERASEDAELAAALGTPPHSPERPGGPLRFTVTDAIGRQGKRPSVAFFAAGIGVMFLLFAVSGRSAILVEERESGVLQRILAGRLGLTRLLVGRWLFLMLLGVAQVTAMFVWGSVAFGLELWTPRHLAGFAAVTVATAAAAAAFGLLLSTACRTRARLNGVSVVLVLVLSAVGGSMFPRFLMPESLRALGRVAFNAWALDGYHAVFWYERAPSALWPEILALLGFCAAFLVAARLLARRWEAA
jgi:ABC-2 type transport system permease protein